MKILVSVLVFVTALTTGAQALASDRDMNALFPPPQPNTTLGERPDKPELTAPTYFQKVGDSKVTLQWKASPNAEAYHVQVATDPNFKWLVKEENIYKGTSLEVSGLQGGKHYFWRVSGVKPDNKAGHMQGAFASSMFEATGK
ncbi:fibronectin type III domain-containing protein [Bdellovibrio sp. HCB337]|uniref:fibronectin type III domain-containing protein n=1 Tax=Bdellovibrio sp. HCB337 TaxID=3394358 RepID=UPI0039A6C0D1